MYPETREPNEAGGPGKPVAAKASNKLIFPLVLVSIIAIVELAIILF